MLKGVKCVKTAGSRKGVFPPAGAKLKAFGRGTAALYERVFITLTCWKYRAEVSHVSLSGTLTLKPRAMDTEMTKQQLEKMCCRQAGEMIELQARYPWQLVVALESGERQCH